MSASQRVPPGGAEPPEGSCRRASGLSEAWSEPSRLRPRFAGLIGLLIAAAHVLGPLDSFAEYPFTTPPRRDKPDVRLELALPDGTTLRAGFVGDAARAKAFADALETASRGLQGAGEAMLRVTVGARERRAVAVKAGGAKETGAALSAGVAPLLAAHGFAYADPPYQKPADPYVRPQPTPAPVREYRVCGDDAAGCHEWEACGGGVCRSVCGEPCSASASPTGSCPRGLVCHQDVCFHQFCTAAEEGQACGGPVACASGLLCQEGTCRRAEAK